MQVNRLPPYDASDNPTGCCPRFDAEGWDDRELHFQDKLFVRATTKSENYVPIDMGPVFQATFAAIREAGAYDEKDFIVLSHDLSPSQAEHCFAVSKVVPGQEMVRWSGDYLTRVFEGAFENLPRWEGEIIAAVEARQRAVAKNYYFYTTCPKCAEVYGKNYVVAVAEMAEGQATVA